MVYKNYIGGRWVESHTGEVFPSINPANGEVLGEVTRSDAQDVDNAVQAAAAAFDSWRKTPAPKRAELLYRLGDLLAQHKEELARFLTREMGKILPEARGDVQEAIDMAAYMAGEGRRLFGYTVPVELPNKFGMCVRDPVGVVAAITPWNFPIAIPSWKIFPAVMAGNTVVFKPASDTPILGVRFVELIEQAGFPPGVVNLVLGPGGVVGDALVEHPLVSAISFTGSTEMGTAVNVKAARHLKRVHLEMGGKNAITVMDDADLDLALDGIIWSAFGTSGQRCTACSRLLVHEAVKKPLLEKLLARTEALRLGDGLLPTTDVGPIINKRQLESIHSHVDVAKKDGAIILTGGYIDTEGDRARGFFYRPTLLDNVTPDMPVAREEIFGPVLSIITIRSLDEAIHVNNATCYGLSSAIYTRDINRAFTAMRDMTTGIVYINAGTIGAEIQLPFGGTRKTGSGHREAGIAGLDVFTEWKSIYVDFSGKLQRAQIDTHE
jgi:aldehyde dehydrogenase (NAD+)